MSVPSLPDVPGSGGGSYRAQYNVSPEFRKFWETLFKGYPLSDKQLSQMTDTFVKTVWDQMNHCLQHQLQVMKELESRQKEDDNG